MAIEDVTRDLFDRWEQRYGTATSSDLIQAALRQPIFGTDYLGDRTVTPESYRAELAKVQADRPGIRVAVHDHLFKGTWSLGYRFEFRWTDKESRQTTNATGMQSNRIENRQVSRDVDIVARDRFLLA